MASTRFFLDKRNAKEGKPVVLKIAIAHQHKSALISLDAKILPGQWDEKHNKIVKHPDQFILNTYINKMKNAVDSFIIRLTNEGGINSLTATEIKEKCMEELDPAKKNAYGSKRVLRRPENRKTARYGSKRVPIAWYSR